MVPWKRQYSEDIFPGHPGPYCRQGAWQTREALLHAVAELSAQPAAWKSDGAGDQGGPAGGAATLCSLQPGLQLWAAAGAASDGQKSQKVGAPLTIFPLIVDGMFCKLGYCEHSKNISQLEACISAWNYIPPAPPPRKRYFPPPAI